MKGTFSKIAPFAAAMLLVAGSAFAGGAHCGSGDEASAKMTSGDHCVGAKGAMAGSCPVVGKNQSVYSFAVPGAECDHCVQSIQTALMAQKGITCAHVDLASHTAFVIADRSLDKKSVAKVIQTAGFKNKFKGQGNKVQAEFAKVMATPAMKGACSYKASKEKDKI